MITLKQPRIIIIYIFRKVYHVCTAISLRVKNIISSTINSWLSTIDWINASGTVENGSTNYSTARHFSNSLNTVITPHCDNCFAKNYF